MEISQINPDGNVYDIKDATARTEIAQIKAQESYSTTEQDTGKKWIDGSTVYRKTIVIGALPNATTKDVPHGITGLKNVIMFAGMARNPTTGYQLPIPYPQVTSSYIAAYVRSDSIRVQVLDDRTAFTQTYVTIEYTKD